MYKSIFFLILLVFSLNAFAISGDIYKVLINSQKEADILISTNVEPLVRIIGGYIVLADRQSSKLLLKSGLKLEFLARDIEKDDLYYDNSRDQSNIQKHQIVYHSNEICLLRVADSKALTSEDKRTLFPILNDGLKIFYKAPAILNPLFSLSNLDIDLEWLVSLINQDSCYSYVDTLQGLVPRGFLVSSDRHRALNWLRHKFLEFGYSNVWFHEFTFEISGPWSTGYNIIAEKPGNIYPNQQIVIGAHYDNINDLPGADDNGSGTAGVLEIARVLSDIDTRMTFKFILFDAEEYGLHGSHKYAFDAAARGDDILCMINMDMIGHIENENEASIGHYENNLYAELMVELAGLYADIQGIIQIPPVNWDHFSFAQAGYDIAYLREYIFSPHWHYETDSTTYMNFDYMARMVKTVLATGYVINQMIPKVVISTVLDVGDGQSLQVNWIPHSLDDISEYRIYYNTVPPTTPRFVVVSGDDSSIIVDGLTEDTEYSFLVYAYNDQGGKSFIGEMAYGTPYYLPRQPQNLTAMPEYRAISLSWRGNNTELDFNHYSLIRDGELLQHEIYSDNYTDNDFSLGNSFHSYQVVAVDNDGNTSDLSGIEPVLGRAATLEKSKLLAINRSGTEWVHFVDEAATGLFIRDALSGFSFDYISDSAYSSNPLNLGLIDLIDYEVVVLGGESLRDDNFGIPDSTGGILEAVDYYMSMGGKVVIFGRWGDANDDGGENCFSFSEDESDCAYRSKFHIIYRCQNLTPFIDNIFYSDLVGAHSQVEGYPQLIWDSLATVEHTDLGFECTGIPGPTYVHLLGSGFEIIYRYDSRYDNSNESKAIAWRYLGSDYQYVFFEFPLSFMERSSALLALQTAVSELLTIEPAGFVLIEPDTLDVTDTIDQISIYVGDFGDGKIASEVNVGTIVVNAQMLPSSVSTIPSHPSFTGEVILIDISSQAFIDSYGTISDTNTFDYMVFWNFTGDSEMQTAIGNITLIKPESVLGDANGDGMINVGDAVYLINHIFRSGPPPEPLESGDANCDGTVNVGDAV
ncbi:MAG: M28 family peptidase, partial [candidate division Zixibacteria bacterium]